MVEALLASLSASGKLHCYVKDILLLLLLAGFTVHKKLEPLSDNVCTLIQRAPFSHSLFFTSYYRRRLYLFRMDIIIFSLSRTL